MMFMRLVAFLTLMGSVPAFSDGSDLIICRGNGVSEFILKPQVSAPAVMDSVEIRVGRYAFNSGDGSARNSVVLQSVRGHGNSLVLVGEKSDHSATYSFHMGTAHHLGGTEAHPNIPAILNISTSRGRFLSFPMECYEGGVE